MDNSVKLVNEVKTLNTELDQLRFFESIKMEFDIASDFCKHQIRRITKNHHYSHEFQNEPESLEKFPYFNSHDLFIKEQLANNPDNSWEFYFFSENDHTFIIENLKSFFSGSPYDNTTRITVKPKCNTKLCNAFHDIYFFCSPVKKLKSDRKFLTLLKNISIFSDLNFGQLYYKLLHY